MIGDLVERIIPEHFLEGHRAGLKRRQEDGPVKVIGHTVELVGKHKDGSMIPVELSLSMWSNGTSRFFGGILRDISERKKSEEQIRMTERKFRSIAETAHDAIISADAKGQIESWNKAATEIFGYSEEEAIGQPLEIIIPEKYRELHRNGIARVVGGGEKRVIGHTVELQGQTKDGRIFPVELSLSTWNGENGIHFSGIIRDITERKLHEKSLEKSRETLKEKAQKLKEANYEIKQKSNQLQSLSQKLAKYLSRKVYDPIFEGERDVKIESYRKKLTVFFSDIQGFTELSDRMESESLTHILNRYLNEMSKIATEHGGTLDKFIGDAIMIFFGDPDTKGSRDDAITCVKMALDMRDRLKDLHSEWQLLGISEPLNVRMGINTGFCTVGNFGSEERMDYTIVGSQVNLASRLENLANTNQILISEETYLLVRDEISCEKKDEINVKGFSYPIQTYQVVDLIENLDKKTEKLEKLIDGFELKLDATQLAGESRTQVRKILESAMEMLG